VISYFDKKKPINYNRYMANLEEAKSSANNKPKNPEKNKDHPILRDRGIFGSMVRDFLGIPHSETIAPPDSQATSAKNGPTVESSGGKKSNGENAEKQPAKIDEKKEKTTGEKKDDKKGPTTLHAQLEEPPPPVYDVD
jgi:hypothetical protein